MSSAHATIWRRSAASFTAMGRACWWMRPSWSPTARSRWQDAGSTISPFRPIRCTLRSAPACCWPERGCFNFSPAELELIRSSGEENVGGIAALGKALVLLQRIGLDVIQEEEQALTGRALAGTGASAGPQALRGQGPGLAPVRAKRAASLPLTWETSCPAGWPERWPSAAGSACATAATAPTC